MSEENLEKTVDSAKTIVSNQLAAFLGLREKNPKLFYGIIAVLVLPLLFMMVGGGDEGKPALASGPTIKELAKGQRYTLKSPNVVDQGAKVRLVPVPGTLAAYDDSEEDDRKDIKDGTCQHVDQGTPVEALEFADAYGKRNMFVKVKVIDGVCKDKDGWVLAIDVQ
jgi:hypothetical protein